jgi:hypothetical protein
MLGAIGANDFPRQANEYGQADSDHARSRTDPDNAERLTSMYGLDGLPYLARLTPTSDRLVYVLEASLS